VKTHRMILLAALSCLIWSTPVLAAPDGTRGMALMSASIEADGSLFRGVGVVSNTHLGGANSGLYQVLFERDVTECFYVATLGRGTADNAANGFIEATPRANNANGVFVSTTSTADAAADRAFFLLVFCAQ
jgi:hypothetical protein